MRKADYTALAAIIRIEIDGAKAIHKTEALQFEAHARYSTAKRIALLKTKKTHWENKMRLPSIKTLSAVFTDPKQARAILEMSRAQLLVLPAGEARARDCYTPPKTYDVRMHCLNAIDAGLHGIESMGSTGGEYAEFLNTGDTYAPTLIRWRGVYRVQSVGDFIETMERAGVRFA